MMHDGINIDVLDQGWISRPPLGLRYVEDGGESSRLRPPQEQVQVHVCMCMGMACA
jgi:hypothetical protein